ncbi:MAG: hypothetical protein K9J79_06605 [Desulfobacteraceae bacterium]|nr:hypothetical protein [Desulfobacteraceae bacterium]MCF8095018.1 hypothetical protein [Desulfobacteraceae bacterium]
MKKKAMIMLAAIVALGLVAGASWAGPWNGPRDGYNRGYVHGPNGGYCYYGGDGPGPGHQGFYEETADLRRELAGKRGEYQALMAQDNPDSNRAAQLQEEMVRLREQIRSKARAYADSSEYERYSNRGYRGGWGHHRGMCW